MKTKSDYAVLILAVLALLGSVAAIIILPDQVPIHWNMKGEVDNYGSKYIYLFLGSMGLISFYLMNFTKKIDPYTKNIDKNPSAYATMRNIISVMMSMISIISILAILIKEINTTMVIMVFMGISLIIIGNYMPRVPHNYFMGVKTPWAIADENNWKKTQRFGGYSFVICGLLMSISALFNNQILIAISFSLLLICVVASYIYSWYLFKRGYNK